MEFKTTDLCDAHEDVQVADPLLRHFGRFTRFAGLVATLKLFEDNTLVRAALEEPGAGRVLVVDGGGSLRCALVGDQIGDLAVRSGWAGIVIFGCVRDSVELGKLPLGIMAVDTHPRRSVKRGEGQRDVPVRFAGVSFHSGQQLYADEDGLIVAESPLI
jgi:regulator of ribonuclease activity A